MFNIKKIINDPKNYLHEMLEGIYTAYPKELSYIHHDLACLVRTQLKPGKVAIVTGGGSGHLPLFLGYVGQALCDACAVGDVFQSPSADQILRVTQHVNQGSGVLYLYGNYNGDIFNFDMAASRAAFEFDIKTETVLAVDDISSPKAEEGEREVRRGVAGIYFLYKCAGAAADAMLSLSEVKRVAEKASKNTATLGVALSPATVPRVGKPSFTIDEGTMEIGMGIHGEAGLRSGTLQRADVIVEELLERIITELSLKKEDRVAVLVNGLGATPLDEQFIVVRKINQMLQAKGIHPHRYDVGEFATSLEMSGLSVSVLKLDDELETFVDHPVHSPFIKQRLL